MYVNRTAKINQEKNFFWTALNLNFSDRRRHNHVTIFCHDKKFLSDEGPMLETLDYTIRIGSTPTFLYFDLYLYSAYAAHFVHNIYSVLLQHQLVKILLAYL